MLQELVGSVDLVKIIQIVNRFIVVHFVLGKLVICRVVVITTDEIDIIDTATDNAENSIHYCTRDIVEISYIIVNKVIHMQQRVKLLKIEHMLSDL